MASYALSLLIYERVGLDLGGTDLDLGGQPTLVSSDPDATLGS